MSEAVIARAHRLLISAHASVAAMHDIAAMYDFPVFVGPTLAVANKIAEAMNLLIDLCPANEDRPSEGDRIQ
jgi:hypothetical protein